MRKVNTLATVVCIALLGCSQNKGKVNTLKQPKQTQTSSSKINGLKNLTLQDDNGALSINFEAEHALSPNIFRLSDPQRIVVDLVNTRNMLENRTINSDNTIVKEVTVNEFNDNDNVLSRVVIVLNEKVEYEAHALSNGLALKIETSNTQNQFNQQSNESLSIAEFSPIETQKQDTVSNSSFPVQAVQDAVDAESGVNQLVKILSRPGIDGTEVELIFSKTLRLYNDFSLKGPNRIVLDLQYVENVLEQGKTVNVASDEVAKIRLGESKNKTRAVIDLAGASVPQYKLSKEKNRLKVYIPSKRLPDSVPAKSNKAMDIAVKKLDLPTNSVAALEREPVSITELDYPVDNNEASEQAINAMSLSNADVSSSQKSLTVPTLSESMQASSQPDTKPTMASTSIKASGNQKASKNSVETIKFEKNKDEALVKLMLEKDNLDYKILDSEEGLLRIELNNVSYKKSKIRRLLKKQNYLNTAIKTLEVRKPSKNKILLEVAMKDQAIFEVGEQDKSLLVRVKPNNAPTNTVTTPSIDLAKTVQVNQNPLLDSSQNIKTSSASSLNSDNEIETLANDFVEVQGLDDNVKNTFPQERVIENPLGIEVQDSSKPNKNYAYVKEEFMSDSIADGEPLSQMGSILSGAVQGKKFTGRRISLDFKDAEVKSIFKLIAEISQFNIIISDDVTGRITIRLDEVPWDQAFAIILQTRGLWFEKYGNIIRVAPAAKLQKEKEAAADAEKAAKAVKPLDILFKPVSFAQAGTLEKQVQSVLSERGTVDIDSRTNTLIIKDIREHLDKAKRMIDILDTQTPQVTIEARIVEATTTFTRSFGINWSGSASFTSATGNPTGLFFPNSIGIPNFALNFPIEAGAINTQANLRLGSVNNILDLDLAIALGEQEGNFKLISSPKVTVLDNSSATISAGTQIPFQTQSDNLGQNVTFQTANTSLTVTPHITNDGSILMNISASRDEPNFSAAVDGNPTIDQRTASTEVLVKSGNTTVIGGIYSTSSGGSQSRLPFFHRIPIIGALFKNYNKTVRRSELLIFVTPRIVGDERKVIREVRE